MHLRLAVALVIAAIPAAALKVNTDYDRLADFSGYKTFAWKGCEVIDEDPVIRTGFFYKRIRAIVNDQLSTKGLVEAAEGSTPDLWINCMVGTQDKQRLETTWAGWYGPYYGPSWYYGWGAGWPETRTVDWTEGVLVVDLIDSGQKALVWRAVCQGTVSDKPKTNRKRVQSAMDKAFKSYPPKGVE